MIEIDTGTEELLCSIEDRVATVTLNKPDKRNALGDILTPALREVLLVLEADSRVGCVMLTGAGGHWLLIKCYEMADASAVQPFAYFHLMWAAILAITVFDEELRTAVVVGTALIVSAGLFTLWRERKQR